MSDDPRERVGYAHILVPGAGQPYAAMPLTREPGNQELAVKWIRDNHAQLIAEGPAWTAAEREARTTMSSWLEAASNPEVRGAYETILAYVRGDSDDREAFASAALTINSLARRVSRSVSDYKANEDTVGRAAREIILARGAVSAEDYDRFATNTDVYFDYLGRAIDELESAIINS